MSAREDGPEAGVEDRMEQTGAAQDVAAMEGDRPPGAAEAEPREQAASEEAAPDAEPMPAAEAEMATEPAAPSVEQAPADDEAAGAPMQTEPEPEPAEDPAEELEPEPFQAMAEPEPAEEPEPMEAELVGLAEEPEPEPMEAAAEVSLEAPEALPRLEPDDGRQWYVVHCYSGYENKVRHNLEQRIETMNMKDKIFDVVVPTEEEMEVKDGKRRTVERRVFPGYILVQMLMDEDSWYVVRDTPGVTGFVGMGNEPTPLRPEEVAQIVKRMEAEAPRIK